MTHKVIAVEYRKNAANEWQASRPDLPAWRGPHAAVPDQVRKFAEDEIIAMHGSISIRHRFIYDAPPA
jgi:hypothetical protein